MCGIVGAVSDRNVVNILIEGLKRLEYRGYDSAGVAVIGPDGSLDTRKASGKVARVAEKIDLDPLPGGLGIAHTRWATHGVPNDRNAHPHLSDDLAVVHNGIIENYKEIKQALQKKGYTFVSETDTECIAHLLHDIRKTESDLFECLKKAVAKLEGAYGLALVGAHDHSLYVARSGSPLVIGLGIDENFVASDQLALRQVTDRFVYLEEGDLAKINKDSIEIIDQSGRFVEREMTTISDAADVVDRGSYKHFMLKEIYEQPDAVQRTIEGRLGREHVLEQVFGVKAHDILSQVKNVQIIACGTSYHAGLITKHWLEGWAGVHCQVDIASEFRYRKVLVPENCLFVSISQSGETADTLAALRLAKELGFMASLTICNVPSSSLVRESDLSLMTLAGPEIGVASTKAFTTQLVALQILSIALAKHNGMSESEETRLVQDLHKLPELCRAVLNLDEPIAKVSEQFVDKHHALFLGRGVQCPVAMEGALKLKEISYIHAEAYAAGELKHGPLALVDDDMPVVAVAPKNDLLEKLKSNLEEVQARGGKLFVFADAQSGFADDANTTVIDLPHVPPNLEPIIYTLPLQLLSYHVAVLRGTDVDQPRNLAKSVTVE